MKCSLGISNFLEEISSPSNSIVFLYFFALIAEEGFLISSCYFLELCIQMLISFLFSFAFSFWLTSLCIIGSSFIFLKRSLVFPILLFSSTSLHWLLRKAFFFSLLFFRTLHSNGYIFPFLVCVSLLFFSQLFVRPPQTAILLFCISFPWGWSWSLSPVPCHKPHSIVHQALYLSDLGP